MAVILAAFVLFVLPSVASDVDVDVAALAQAVDNRYNHQRTLEAEFTEIYTGAGAERTESGTLWLKKPGKMRWEYRSPREKVFLSDGRESWFFVPGEKQARRIPARQLDDLRSPLAFLLGKSHLLKELKELSLATDVHPSLPGGIVLKGVPVGMEQQLSGVELEIALDSQIARIVLQGTDGSVTEYRFSYQKQNIRIDDDEFHFVPPTGVEVIDGSFDP